MLVLTPDALEQPARDAVDWIRASALFASYLRHRAPALSSDAHKDLVQEALVRLYRTSRREPIRNLEAIANTIASSVVEDHRRATAREKAFLKRLAQLRPGGPLAQTDEPGDLGDPMDRLYFLVIAYFNAVHAPCADLAEQFFSRNSWKDLAAARGRSDTGIRKLWSRCTDRLRQAFLGDDDIRRRWFDE